MKQQSDPNITLLELTVARLGKLADEMVFVGGCATGLLLTDTGAPPIRATKDVDVLTEVATKSEYYAFCERLRSQGFTEDQTADAPICRWSCDAILLDVMPTNPDILNFGNEWYEKAMRCSKEISLPSGSRICVITSPYFLATKLAAFENRGNNDYVMSHDIEDMVAVVDGRPEVVEEVRDSEISLKQHLASRFCILLDDAKFILALSGHLPGDSASQSRLPLLLERINKIASL